MARALIKRGGGRPGHAGFARGRRESRRRVWADSAGRKKEGERRAPTGGAVVSEREGGSGERDAAQARWGAGTGRARSAGPWQFAGLRRGGKLGRGAGPRGERVC